MNREQKLENALRKAVDHLDVSNNKHIGSSSRLHGIMKSALETELVPIKGNLYYFYDHDSGDGEFGVFYRIRVYSNYPYLSDSNRACKYIRKLTDQEWLDLGSPQLQTKD